MVTASSVEDGAALDAADTNAVLLLSSIGRAADSLMASKHALLRQLRAAKLAAVQDADDIDGIVETITTNNEGLLYIRCPLTPVLNRKLLNVLDGNARLCAEH